MYRNQVTNESTNELSFQTLAWNFGDFEADDGSDEYIIYASGVTSESHSVVCKIYGFTPYFYVQIPEHYNERLIKKLFETIKYRMGKLGSQLISYELTKKKKLYPYLANKKFPVMRLVFSSKSGFDKAKWILKYPLKVENSSPSIFETFDTSVDHLNRFCHIRDIKPGSWVTVSDFELEESNSQIGIRVNWKNVRNNNEITKIAPLSIFSWDLECLPEDTEKFPDSTKKNDVISQIGITISKYGTNEVYHAIFTNKPCSDIPGTLVFSNNTEKEMLEEFAKFFVKVDPDLLIGYNTWGFDDKYLWNRLLMHNIQVDFLSRIPSINATFETKVMKSDARGCNTFEYIKAPGRESIDLIVVMRRDHKLELYGLNAVAEHFLKEHKVEMEYSLLFKKLVGTPDEIAECAVYCVQDSNLPVRLLNKLNVLPDSIEMAKATYVPLEWLLFRGQQCKVFSLISKEARLANFMIPEIKSSVITEGYKGATVMEPLIGQYYTPIAGLDFQSLYPSIMIAYNLCYSTFVLDDMLDYVKTNNIPVKQVKIDDRTYTFVQIEDDAGAVLEKGTRGLIGQILQELWKGRSATKKLMRTEKDPFVYALLNGKQLAQKVTMNSVYGFTGSNKGILPLKQIAESVTAIGRQVIDKTSKITTESFSGLTVYGDSIPGYELITVDGIDIPVEEFSKLVITNWEEYRHFKVGDITINNKEFKEVNNYKALTHLGYQPIKKIIRHTTTKKLYKVKAIDDKGHIHTVTATEGHSFIKDDLTTIAAEDLKVGDELFEYSVIID
jgi:DNA polymerase delta subunit 1